MKINLSKVKQLYSGESPSHARFKLAALPLAFMSATAALIPVQSVQAEGANVIEEVFVTARKREESLQETPVAVNVLTSEMLSSARVEGVKDLGTIVPGLVTTETVSSTAGLIFLRGVGSGSLTPIIDQAVALNVDGVGITSAALMNAGMFDLERIEVLRGPQALFFGKNSPGGVVAIHTKDPSDEFELEVTAQYETEREEQAIRAIISGPLGENLSGRLSLGWSDRDKSRLNVQNFDVYEDGPLGPGTELTAVGTSSDPIQTEKIYAMGTLLWEPSDNLTATLKYARLEDNQDGHTNWNFQRTRCGQGDPQVVFPAPGVDNCKIDGDVQGGGVNPTLSAADPNFPGYEGDGFSNNEDNFVSFEINYDLNDSLSLTSVTGYFDNEIERIGDASFQIASTLFNSVLSESEQWTQEFRLNSNFDGQFNFAAGVYYEEKEINQQNAVVLGNRDFIPVAGLVAVPLGQQFTTQESTAYSVFTELSWAFNEQWTLSAGARYSYEEKEAVIDVNNVFVRDDTKIRIPLLESNPDWNNVSPQVTLSYQLNDDIMFFASYKEGFKSGGFDAAWKPITLLPIALSGGVYDAIYDEEEVDGFEVGMKSTLLDGTLRFNATLYRYEYDGLQLTNLEFDENDAPVIAVQNAASATVQGLELETLWLTPVEGLSLTANLAFNDATYDDYIATCVTGQTIAEGCDQNPDPTTGNFAGADMSGESLPNASDWSATFAVDYQVAMGSDWNMGFNVTTSYKDEYNPTSSMLPDNWWQDSYWLTNASVSLFSSDDTWEVYFRGINLTEEWYSATGSTLGGDGTRTGTAVDGGEPDLFQFVNGGRQFVLGVTYRM